jgi:hypothetical protein
MITIEGYNWEDDFVIAEHEIKFEKGTAIDNILAFLYENPKYPRDEENMLKLAEHMDLWSKIKDRQKRLERIFCSKYNESIPILDAMRDGKSILLQSDYETGLQMIDTLKNHRFSENLFKANENEELIFQLAILFKIDGVNCKSLLDKVKINHKSKKIYPEDLKTGDDLSFMGNFNRYQYYKQAAMYTLAIDEWRLENGFDDYEVMPFKFIYISKKNPYVPCIFEMDTEFTLDHINGFENKYGKYEKGIIDLVKDYKWYIKNEVYDVKRDLHENNGVDILSNINK